MTPIKKKSLENLHHFSFLFLAYPGIDEVIQAVKSKEVDGMLLDRFTASYYQSRGKLKSLIIVKKLELQREVGVLFSQDKEKLAECLNFHLSSILKSVQTFTDTYKVTLIKYKKRFASEHSSAILSSGLHRRGTLAYIQWLMCDESERREDFKLQVGFSVNSKHKLFCKFAFLI